MLKFDIEGIIYCLRKHLIDLLHYSRHLPSQRLGLTGLSNLIGRTRSARFHLLPTRVRTWLGTLQVCLALLGLGVGVILLLNVLLLLITLTDSSSVSSLEPSDLSFLFCYCRGR